MAELSEATILAHYIFTAQSGRGYWHSNSPNGNSHCETFKNINHLEFFDTYPMDLDHSAQ